MAEPVYRWWEVQGEYGYWVVYEYRNDGSRATYSQIRGIRTRKQAWEIAAALDRAFGQGIDLGLNRRMAMEG